MLLIRNKAFLQCFSVKKLPATGGLSYPQLQITFKENPTIQFEISETRFLSDVVSRVLTQEYFPCTNLIFSKWLVKPTMNFMWVVERYVEYRGLTLHNPNPSTEDGTAFSKAIYSKDKPSFLIYSSTATELKNGFFNKSKLDFIADYLVPLLEDGPQALPTLKLMLEYGNTFPSAVYSYIEGRLERGETGLLTENSIQVNLEGMTLEEAVGKIRFRGEIIEVVDLESLKESGYVETKSTSINYTELLSKKIKHKLDFVPEILPPVIHKFPPLRQQYKTQRILGV